MAPLPTADESTPAALNAGGAVGSPQESSRSIRSPSLRPWPRTPSMAQRWPLTHVASSGGRAAPEGPMEGLQRFQRFQQVPAASSKLLEPASSAGSAVDPPL
eukprot:15476573-Alexandrium_andersonii.AAC.2